MIRLNFIVPSKLIFAIMMRLNFIFPSKFMNFIYSSKLVFAMMTLNFIFPSKLKTHIFAMMRLNFMFSPQHSYFAHIFGVDTICSGTSIARYTMGCEQSHTKYIYNACCIRNPLLLLGSASYSPRTAVALLIVLQPGRLRFTLSAFGGSYGGLVVFVHH